MERLTPEFFERSPVACARDLVGVHFLWHGCMGRIVETEAYAAEGDPACHTSFRPSARTFVESHPAGTAYVYLNYGVHWLFNVLVKGPEGAGFVLLRALEPVDEVDPVTAAREIGKLRTLRSGPGRLTRALGIDGSAHGRDFLREAATGLFPGTRALVIESPRIGISRAKDLPWRFHESGNPHVSR